MASDEPIVVGVVAPGPNAQPLVALKLPRGAAIRTALCAAGLRSLVADVESGVLQVGVFGERQSLERALRSGDRVEVYRPLQTDPKEARKRRS